MRAFKKAPNLRKLTLTMRELRILIAHLRVSPERDLKLYLQQVLSKKPEEIT